MTDGQTDGITTTALAKLQRSKALSTLATMLGSEIEISTATVAQNGDCRRMYHIPDTVSPFWVTVAEFGDSRRFGRQSPNLATVAVFGDSRRIRRL